ncbi:hypothetical protein R1sor_010760 [Riccia sorocarpa]|uniref:Uncharacterized protein n=1 Tax=Riccia sorocarpa TaxID=122646 RepID=A0ABD3I0U7_9MARC
MMDKRKLETSLRALMPEGRIIVDYTPSGRVASLYAPNTQEEHQIFLEWWDQKIDGEDWILGDSNNVELHYDSKGKPAVILGAEERTWTRFTYRTDMINAYLSAVTTEGGVFTRLAFCGERFDRARLDRFYLSNRKE